MVGEGFLSTPHISWWNAFGSYPLAPGNLPGDDSDSLAGVKVVSAGETEQGVVDRQSDVKNSRGVPKHHGASFSLQSPSLELGFTQPRNDKEYPCAEQQYYGVVSAYGSQVLPLNMETEDGTIYVNSKQYHGIIRRRKSRAKAAAATVLDHNKLTSRFRKPYMHHSRHLHALRRPRGSGGRFLNTKSQDIAKKADETELSNSRSQLQQSNSQNSQVIHPEKVIVNLSKRLNVSGSEVTSMKYFISSSIHPLGGMVVPSKWIATMDNGSFNFET